MGCNVMQCIAFSLRAPALTTCVWVCDCQKLYVLQDCSSYIIHEVSLIPIEMHSESGVVDQRLNVICARYSPRACISIVQGLHAACNVCVLEHTTVESVQMSVRTRILTRRPPCTYSSPNTATVCGC